MNLVSCIHLGYRYHNQSKIIFITSKRFSVFFFLVCTAAYMCVLRILSMRSTLLNRFISAQYSTVNYRHYVVQKISRMYSACNAVTLYPLNNNVPFILCG